jgi:hypothetical protein
MSDSDSEVFWKPGRPTANQSCGIISLNPGLLKPRNDAKFFGAALNTIIFGLVMYIGLKLQNFRNRGNRQRRANKCQKSNPWLSEELIDFILHHPVFSSWVHPFNYHDPHHHEHAVQGAS